MTRHPDQKRRSQARWKLPPLSTWEACLLASLLEQALCAIWQEYGDDMADHHGMRGDETPRPADAVWASDNPDNEDFPF
jgi:hypothetical protein